MMDRLLRHNIELCDSTRALWHWCNMVKWNDRMAQCHDTKTSDRHRNELRAWFADSYKDFQKTFK